MKDPENKSIGDPELWKGKFPKFEVVTRGLYWTLRASKREESPTLTFTYKDSTIILPVTADRARKMAVWLNRFAEWLDRSKMATPKGD